MNDMFYNLSTIINKNGYILNHNLDAGLSEYIFYLVEQGVLIGCDKIESTKNFMNSAYNFTWVDNRFNLYIHTDNNLSWIASKSS